MHLLLDNDKILLVIFVVGLIFWGLYILL